MPDFCDSCGSDLNTILLNGMCQDCTDREEVTLLQEHLSGCDEACDILVYDNVDGRCMHRACMGYMEDCGEVIERIPA